MHKLLTDHPGEKMLFLGNEAIARGAIEAGVAFASTYPGTPSSEISLYLFQVSRESDLYFEYSTNEKVALEVAAAAANSGIRSMCIMKHVGMNVAADTLMTLAYVGIKAGLVILTADDPFMFSSQNEQDNRYYGKLSGLPVLEPSSVDEAKTMTAEAIELSEQLGEPVILRTTTRINHSTSVVELGEMGVRITKGDFIKDPFNYVTVPAVSRKLHARLLKNIGKAEAISEQSPFNIITGQGVLGIICNGVSYNYVKDAAKDLDISQKIKTLRIGFSHPMPGKLIKSFLKGCKKVLIAEEGEPYMEESVKAFAQEEGLSVQIAGKGDSLFSRLFEFDPAMVRRVMADFFDIQYTPVNKLDLSDIPEIPQRPPNLCAGCSHRATFYALKKATDGMDTIHPTDIGCYTLGFLPPLSTGDFLICMGSSTGTSGGFSKVTDKKVVSIIGDSTFFHSGISGLINGVFNNHDFTLIILDNRTTAMTGHQPNPGVDMNELGFDGYNKISIEKLVKALGVQHVSVIKPLNIKKSISLIKDALNFKGVSVVIAQEKCVLYAKSLKQLKGKAFRITNKCKNHRDCINELACPAFFIDNSQVKINESLCTGCSICAQICPEKAIVPVKG
ncbi:MAG: indolepyruvate ferredoxin oxidoreductase subunit alpha [Deltaproteobacteria bacterium]|nr:indolepyruvate ferredoxin oxidoreductase subunit alpha [Deltaproteobacteria bacterium]MBW2218181.1 indolepyruvate ferredoxin oxidoreductase subunit alpha [Deltaproteobacteria bacterium]